MENTQRENGLKDFVWSDKGFSFQYPEFKDWNVKGEKKIDNNNYIIYLEYPDNVDFEIAPQIRITTVPEWGTKTLKSKSGYITQKTNTSGVLYDRIQVQHDPEMLAFFAEDFGVTITPISTPENYGFSKDIFFERIIKTFTFKK